MSNHQIEKKLDILINLLETMPTRIIKEIEEYEIAKDFLRKKRIEADMKFLAEHNSEINKMTKGE